MIYIAMMSRTDEPMEGVVFDVQDHTRWTGTRGDEAEDVVMKLFSNTLHGDAKKWYDNLPNASITSMDQFEEVFLEEWGIKSEDIPILLKNFEDIKQSENETLFDFQSRFEGTLYQIPEAIVLEESMLSITIPMRSGTPRFAPP
jgi:hypothetical protein